MEVVVINIVPAADISVFGYQYTILNEYRDAYSLLLSQGPSYRGEDILKVWTALRNQTAILYQTLIISFEKEEIQSSGNLTQVYILFTLNFIINGLITLVICNNQ